MSCPLFAYKAQLENRGFLVVEIVSAPNSKPPFINDRQPPPSLPQGADD
jgi:hypothetical protein